MAKTKFLILLMLLLTASIQWGVLGVGELVGKTVKITLVEGVSYVGEVIGETSSHITLLSGKDVEIEILRSKIAEIKMLDGWIIIDIRFWRTVQGQDQYDIETLNYGPDAEMDGFLFVYCNGSKIHGVRIRQYVGGTLHSYVAVPRNKTCQAAVADDDGNETDRMDFPITLQKNLLTPPSSLRDFDTDNNGQIDNSEFFEVIDMWTSGQISNSLFFQIVDAWVNRTQVKASDGLIEREIAYTIWDLTGRRLYSVGCSYARSPLLTWRSDAINSQPAGVYLASVRDCMSGTVSIRRFAVIK